MNEKINKYRALIKLILFVINIIFLIVISYKILVLISNLSESIENLNNTINIAKRTMEDTTPTNSELYINKYGEIFGIVIFYLVLVFPLKIIDILLLAHNK